MTLAPIVEGAEIRAYDKGRYKIQLELPPGSTLTEGEIERILALSSWEINPKDGADNAGEGRAVLIAREKPSVRAGVELRALQVSGIGWQEMEYDGKVWVIEDDTPFQPPSRRNFMKMIKGATMGTSYAKGTTMTASRPSYRAAGTYIHPELVEKVTKTMKVASFGLEAMAVPNVEAYGRFLDPELANEDGPFGFAVLPAPSAEKRRVVAEVMEKFDNVLRKGGDMVTDILGFYTAIAPAIASLTHGLRELHDRGYVHLQTHLSNVYDTGNVPYVVDWATMRKLSGDREGNLRNRIIDITRPVNDFNRLFSVYFGGIIPKGRIEAGGNRIREIILEVYSGHPEDEVHSEMLATRALQVYGKRVDDLMVTVQWMKDEGFEGFQGRKAKKKQAAPAKKIGRNAPCPCGSGRKSKRCCGR